MKFAICNELFEGWSLRRAFRYVAQQGYQGVELAPFTLAPRITDLTPSSLREIRGLAAEAGLEVAGLHWLLARTEGMHLTAGDNAARDATADYLIALARACRELGGEVMVFGSPPQRSLPDGLEPERGYERAAAVFRKAMPAVADCGVRLCIEPLSPLETNFVNTCADGLRLREMVDHPSFQLHLDVKAMASEAIPTPELIRAHAGGAGHFHANDANLQGPGFGDTDFVPIFAALRDAGYDRWISVEVFDTSPGAEALAERSLAYLKQSRDRAASGAA